MKELKYKMSVYSNHIEFDYLLRIPVIGLNDMLSSIGGEQSKTNFYKQTNAP